MEVIKQVFWSMAALLIAAGVLVGMVIYTLAVMRTAQMRILTGELTYVYRDDSDR